MYIGYFWTPSMQGTLRRRTGICIYKYANRCISLYLSIQIHVIDIYNEIRSRSPFILGNDPMYLSLYKILLASSRLCTNQSSFHASGPPVFPTLLQYYCTATGQYTTPHLTPLVCYASYTIGNGNIV